MDFDMLLHREEPAMSDSLVVTANAASRSRGQQHQPRYNGNRISHTAAERNEPKVVCQYCNRPNHTARNCFRIKGYPQRNGGRPQANTAARQSAPNHPSWIIDTGASHHIVQDLEHLTLADSYPGSDKVLVGDGTGLEITHIGHTTLNTKHKSLNLNQVLCVPNMKSNLLSVSKLCKTNNCSVEFFPSCFVVKDLNSGQALLQGPIKQDLYQLPCQITPHTNPTTLRTSLHSTSTWHHKLGHPYPAIMKHLTVNHQLPIKVPSSHECSSCYCAKSHKLPFSNHHIRSTRPLELIYSDVWGPTPIRSLDGYLYYVIFIDHFSKYVWLYPMKNKSDVFNIFAQFKTIVEKHFNLPILTFFSDNGGEFVKLKHFLATHGISH